MVSKSTTLPHRSLGKKFNAAPFAEGERFTLVSTGGEVLAVCERRDARTVLHRVLTYEPV